MTNSRRHEPRRSFVTLLAALLIAVGCGACRADAQRLSSDSSPGADNWLIGQWARDRGGCVRPELIFRAGAASIQTDADGHPIEFEYPEATYDVLDRRATVFLKKAHPYGKTPSQTALSFVLRQDHTVEMESAVKESQIFVLCEDAVTN